MHTLVLQDWCTVGGQETSPTTLIQERGGWLDTTPYQDLIFYLDVAQVNPVFTTITMTYETSPIEDDAYFTPVVAAFNLTVTGAIRRDDARLTQATTAVAKYVRWKVTAPSTTTPWDTTFRVLVSANAPGS
jgi:hypothetical protein